MATELKKTDVLIVGMGATGGVAALPLAQAGLEVIGLEAGTWLSASDFAPDELRNNYRGWPQLVQKANHEVPTHRRREGAAHHVFHAEIRLPILDADLVHGNDIRMRQAPRRLGLAAKSTQVRRRRMNAAQDHLERDVPLQLVIPRLVHDAHAAAADLFKQFVIAECGG